LRDCVIVVERDRRDGAAGEGAHAFFLPVGSWDDGFSLAIRCA
jgi:hypothetical protein